MDGAFDIFTGAGRVLRRLELENFLLFEKTVFEFADGLNAVSGETGAGKSLVARALGLALGGRGGQDVIRSGTNETRIRAVFEADGIWPDEARKLAGSDGMVTVDRTVRREGGGGVTVNGKSVTAQTLRQALAPLVDFAAQNEHMRLADPAHQLELLDAYGKLAQLAGQYREKYQAALSLHKRLKAGREERELVRIRLERAKEELDAIRKVSFDPASDLDLEAEIKEMSHAAAIVQAAAEAAERLQGGEPSVIDALASAWKAMERMAEVSPRLREAGEDLSAALEAAESALAKLGDIPDDIEADPERLDALIGRSEKLKALAKRFECEIKDLTSVAERLAREIEDLSGWDAGEEETRTKLAKLMPGVIEAGGRLGAARRDQAKRLAKSVNRELAGLGMPEAGFSVVFEPVWEEGMPADRLFEAGASGLDEVNFFLSPNPGEAASAVSGGVSGGEASRAVLAIKAALSEVYRPDLMFLDEVDAGVGARLGSELGTKLRDMAATRQVIVITHLPQIAAYAGAHLKVAKRVSGGRTQAWVESLIGDKRVGEVASMIHGSSAGVVTLEQAREMLREGGNLH